VKRVHGKGVLVMRNIWLPCVLSLGILSGCAGAVVEPGHRGLLFDPRAGGLRPGILKPGYWSLGSCIFHAQQNCARIDDFDVTYSTKHEEVHTTSSEGLALDLHLAVIYRPIMSEIYELDTETGTDYYNEIIAPEFRSAARGVFAHHSYTELQKYNEGIEDEVETALRRRTQNKHVEIASITLEAAEYAPEVIEADRARIVGEKNAQRLKAMAEFQAEQKRADLKYRTDEATQAAEAELMRKENERKIAIQDAEIEKLKTATEAETRIMKARATAQEITLLAKAHADEKKADNIGVTPLTVMMHAYDALGSLGGTGTMIQLGDWSKTPRFLFPQMGAFGNPFGLPVPSAETPKTAAASPTTSRVLAATAPHDPG
jgi:regulator of protease activity HflC (stomatin/prohibitin superfamily)